MGKKGYIDFETKKTIHINVTAETHAEFRVTCFRNRVAMSEVLEEFIQLVVAENPSALRMVSNLTEKKRNDTISRLSKTDAESILNVIAFENPLNYHIINDNNKKDVEEDDE